MVVCHVFIGPKELCKILLSEADHLPPKREILSQVIGENSNTKSAKLRIQNPVNFAPENGEAKVSRESFFLHQLCTKREKVL